jgi:hypothetical protein
LLRAPSLGLWSARALLKGGRLVEASERYLEVTRLSSSGGDEAVQKQAQAEAQAELDELAPRVPSIVIELEGATPAETKVSVDGTELAKELIGERRPANPGKHAVIGLRGTEEVRAEVVLAEGEQTPVRLVFTAPLSASTAAPPESPQADRGTQTGSTQRFMGWITAGVGGAGLVVGTTFGVLAMSKRGELEDSGKCRGDQCLRSASDEVNTLQSRRTISTIGFAAGATLVAAGVILVFTAPDGSSQSALHVSPGGVWFEESF